LNRKLKLKIKSSEPPDSPRERVAILLISGEFKVKRARMSNYPVSGWRK